MLAPTLTAALSGHPPERRGRRPDSAKPEVLQRQEPFVRLALEGRLLVKQAASAAGVSRRTMSRWIRSMQERDARPDESADN